MPGKKRGSTKAGSSGRPKLKPDPITEKLVPDPANVLDLRVLIGLLGRSSKEGCWRLYLTLDLDQYVDISESDILHSESNANAQSSIGGTILWVKQAAELHYGSVELNTESKFLLGPITASAFPNKDMSSLNLENSFSIRELLGTRPPCPTVT